ncbi:50S ribosomal protein L29 [Candidatus Woesearchaeota archaeon]|nr:50S ribosomal protein L29 [Candidatus Woesearchaeota archaeon]
MKYAELSAMRPEDLDKKEKEVRAELIKLQSQVATGTAPKSPGQIKQFKKIIARIHTLRTQQQKEVQQQHAGN